ncbi:serine hydrolase domain-containing protein [Streptomyces bullii]|uniref:Serine hydrolase domain-containing protein n=1 Tax=Streptomyces bullii TaxID=349910 RepID=A0ABW0UII0_9ACTN
MRARRRAILAASLTLALAPGAPAAPAFASPAPAAGAHRPEGPNATTLGEALAGLPDAEATAALVRVGGTAGTWHGSAGVHHLDSGRAADPHARFRAGSTTKAVTAAVVLQLTAEGRVGLDTPVQRYLPGLLGRDFRPVTVGQLLNHTSGIPAGDGFGNSFEEQYAHRFDPVHDGSGPPPGPRGGWLAGRTYGADWTEGVKPPPSGAGPMGRSRGPAKPMRTTGPTGPRSPGPAERAERAARAHRADGGSFQPSVVDRTGAPQKPTPSPTPLTPP